MVTLIREMEFQIDKVPDHDYTVRILFCSDSRLAHCSFCVDYDYHTQTA